MSTTILAPSVFDPGNPGAQAISLADQVGNAVVDTAANLAPIAVPFVLAMTAIAWVMRKFGLYGSAGLAGGGAFDVLDQPIEYNADGSAKCRECRGPVEPGAGRICERCQDWHAERAADWYD
jgi:hypothetical protein